MREITAELFYSIFFLPVLVAVGLKTSIDDFKYGKIRNSIIVACIVYTLTIYLAFIALPPFIKLFLDNGMEFYVPYLVFYIDRSVVNILISVTVAYLFWHFKLWGAGDAKLFICYALLIPLGKYRLVYFNYYFSSFLILISIFVPATSFLLGMAITEFMKRNYRRSVAEMASQLFRQILSTIGMRNLGKTLFGFLVFFLAIKSLRSIIQDSIGIILSNQNVIMLLTLFVFRPLAKLFGRNIVGLLILLVIIVSYDILVKSLSPLQILTDIGGSVSSAIFVVLFFPLCKKIIDLYPQEVSSGKTPFAHWMFLGALIAWFI